MELYLFKDEKVIFKGDGTQVKPRVYRKISAPITVNLKPLEKEYNLDDVTITDGYYEQFKKSLIEGGLKRELIYDLQTTKLDVKPISPTLRVFLSLSCSTSDKGAIQVVCSGDDGVGRDEESILSRLTHVYPRDCTVTIWVKRFNYENSMRQGKGFMAEDLPIKVIYMKDGQEDKRYGCEIKKIIVPDVMLAHWLSGMTTFFCFITVTVTLSHRALCEMHLQTNGFDKLDEISRNNWTALTESICSDFVIRAANGAKVKCHKANLAVSSDVFKAMFESKMIENINNSMKMPDMSEAAVRGFLGFIYYWDLTAASKDFDVALEMYQAGHKYSMKKLQSAVGELICAKPTEWFNVDGAVRLLLFAKNVDQVDNDDLLAVKMVRVLKWFTFNKPQVLLKSVEYQELFQKNPQVAMELSSIYLKLA